MLQHVHEAARGAIEAPQQLDALTPHEVLESEVGVRPPEHRERARPGPPVIGLRSRSSSSGIVAIAAASGATSDDTTAAIDETAVVTAVVAGLVLQLLLVQSPLTLQLSLQQ